MRKPAWLRTSLPSGGEFERVNSELGRLRLNTVCSSARCPNLADCWGRGTATVMLLGNVCTRRCRFCAVKTGNPHGRVDSGEPERVARAISELGLKYVVLTSVDRDDLDDSGSGIFARTVSSIREWPAAPKSATPLIEVLTPDFSGRRDLLENVLKAGPDVFGHNLETVGRLSPEVRDARASYRRSLAVLKLARQLAPGLLTKSGLMLGLGETDAEVSQALGDLREASCNIVTIGQYLQPSRRCLRVSRYVPPERFDEFRSEALRLGFKSARCGPLVRSSFRAEEAAGIR